MQPVLVSMRLIGEYNWCCPEAIGAVVDYVGLQESEAALEELQQAEDEAVLALEKAAGNDALQQGTGDWELQEIN
jgi:hypothetical protein